MNSNGYRKQLLNDRGDHDYLDDDYENNTQSKVNEDDTQDVVEALSNPRDKYNISYIVFYLLGMATLLPWNFFLTAEDYWMYKFRNVTGNSTDQDLTPLQKNFTADLTTAASISGTGFLILNAMYSYKISLKFRMIGSILGILVLFIINTIFVEINTDSWQQLFFVITMCIVILINSFAATLTGSLFGIAGLFPSEYITAIVSGQALGGIFSSLALIVALTFGAPANTTAFIYFCVGNVVLIISIGTYIAMSRTSFFRFYTSQNSHKEATSQSQEALTSESIYKEEPNFAIVFKKIYIYAIAESLVFAFTLSVYPAVTVLVQSQYHGNGSSWNDLYFTPVVNYFTFNSGDYLGRILAGMFQWPKNKPHLILIFTFLRVGFIPLLMMTNTIFHNMLPVIIKTDITFILLMIALSVSNGYLANISLIMAPKAVMYHEKEMASSIMAACLSVGLMFGSSASLVLMNFL